MHSSYMKIYLNKILYSFHNIYKYISECASVYVCICSLNCISNKYKLWDNKKCIAITC